MSRTRVLAIVVLLAAAAIHAAALARAWQIAKHTEHGRDFASYYYAVQVAHDGGDPYDLAQLASRARDDGLRHFVQPYLYPPPFVAVMSWVLWTDLATAYRIWFWANSLFLLATLMAVWRWHSRDSTLIACAAVLAGLSAIPDNELMGQANLPVLAATVIGALLAKRDRPLVAGAFLGLACMLKVSPALVVMGWVAVGNRKAVVSACVSASVLSLLTLPIMGFGAQSIFYTDVMRGFLSGEYQGLAVPVDMFGNHSLPNLFAQIWPAEHGLGGMAALVASICNLALLTGALWLMRCSSRSGVAQVYGLGMLVSLMVLMPVYAFEHHLVFMVVPIVAVVVALSLRDLPRAVLPALIPALVFICMPIAEWEQLAIRQGPLLESLMREAKCFGICALGSASAYALAMTASPAVSTPSRCARMPGRG